MFQANSVGFQRAILDLMRLKCLSVHAGGLTAAVALAEANIRCNVIAAAFHDHIFVPVASAQEALGVLLQLQLRSIQGSGVSAQ